MRQRIAVVTPAGGGFVLRRRLAWHLLAPLYMTFASSKCRRLLLAACLSTSLARAGDAQLPGSGNPQHPGALQDIAQLEELAKIEAQRQLPTVGDKQRLQVGPIQSRLQLPRCDNPVKSERAPGLQVPGRVLIELRCEGRAPWHIYVPAKVVGTTAVVLAAHALVTGMVLTAKDLTIEQRDMVGLPPGYLDDPTVAVGLTAGRAIAGGAILTNQQLLGTQAVQRGQSVTLIANAGGISVRMAGKALSDGLVNQRVKVENISSGKVVEGIARSPQVVEIIF